MLFSHADYLKDTALGKLFHSSPWAETQNVAQQGVTPGRENIPLVCMVQHQLQGQTSLNDVMGQPLSGLSARLSIRIT